MPQRSYATGVPITATIHEDGSVSFEVDLSEVSDDLIECGDGTTYSQEDADIIAAAAQEIRNHYEIPAITPRSATETRVGRGSKRS